MSFLIGLAGPSGAGKSALADRLEQLFGMRRFRMDAYYKNCDECPTQPNGEPNWELPESYHLNELYDALYALKAGQSIEIPIYKRVPSMRVGTEPFDPAPIILAEGLQLFADARVRDLFDLKLWLDVSEEIALARRQERQPDYRMDYHEKVLLPAFRQSILPCKMFADISIDGTQSLDEVIRIAREQIESYVSFAQTTQARNGLFE